MTTGTGILMSPRQMPPFRTLLKSRDVEDPINLWVHRPLAYLFAWLVFPTPMTPNMVTFLSILAGVAAGALFIEGSPTAMLVGGLLLWSSAILDGADGILARAKNMSSAFGRAIDGAADSIVAVVTVLPAFYHMWQQFHEPLHMWLMVPAIVLANLHLTLHDYYRESYLYSTRPGERENGKDPAAVASRLEESKGRGRLAYLAMKLVLIPYTETQFKVIRWVDPAANRETVQYNTTEASAALYRKYNWGPMQLWNVLSTAPHAYLLAICAMADRVDVYLWIRLVAMNAILVVAIAWQRRATARTRGELTEMGAFVSPEPEPTP